MDILLSALASDFLGRLNSSLIAKYKKQVTTEKMAMLQRLLLRARIVVEEAEGRHITNQGMHLQLRQLMESMYRGYYVLDTFHAQATHPKRRVAVSQSFNFSSSGNDGENTLQNVLERLETLMSEMKEFIGFLCDCPRLLRQPYSTYMFMDRCMFGRYIEKEQIINFFLQPCAFNDPTPCVLPIIGRREVGKRTLVEHVCNDERVQKQFSHIVYFNSDDLHSLKNDCTIEHQKFVSDGKFLIIVNLINDSDVVVWKRIYSSICYKNIDCKIIIISTREQDSNLGTVQALKLKSLRQDEYLYFFKVLAFGSADPKEHPELLSILMKLATELKCSFMVANVISRLLRANLNVQLWHHVSKVVKEVNQLHFLHFGKHTLDLFWEDSPSYIFTYSKDYPLQLCCKGSKTGNLMQSELPNVKAQDLLIGNYMPSEEKIDVLLWRSPIPPYHSIVAHCTTEKAQLVAPKEKCHKRKRALY